MSRTEAEIRAAVLAALGRVAPDADPGLLKPTDKIREVLEIDSYDFLQFLIALNKQLGVEVPEADYGKLQTLGDVLVYLNRHAPKA